MSRIVTFAKRNRKELKRFIKFMFVGGVGAVIDFGALNILAHGLNLDLRISGTISFAMAVTSNFLWNRYWTYPESRAFPALPQYLQFFVINAMALVIRLPILTLLPGPIGGLLESLGLDVGTAEVLGNNAALAVAVGIAMFWNFFINRFVTYRHIKVGQ
ncbi:MAG: GtrA family protein [Chloroflexi bacterium]|nr:GtrA family protein [Chloroflexota bacterium]